MLNTILACVWKTSIGIVTGCITVVVINETVKSVKQTNLEASIKRKRSMESDELAKIQHDLEIQKYFPEE